MPYSIHDELPVALRGHLPEHAQDIFREAFNHAWQAYAEDPRQEAIALWAAWAAVKKAYFKTGDR